MRIESIRLKHTLHFSDLLAEFSYHDQPVTLILGDQGSGKTGILRFSYQALTWFAARCKDLRAAGLVMLDQDIMQARLQSKIDIRVSFSGEAAALLPGAERPEEDADSCGWQLYKTLNSQGIGISKAETRQLELLAARYQQAQRDDPLLGLPLIAYYPAERFVNEVNILNKNNPAIFQPAHAYEISAIPFTTFSRFFEWFREVCDIENAQNAQMVQDILNRRRLQGPSAPLPADCLAGRIAQAHAEIRAPALSSLRRALAIVLPEISSLFLLYQPKLQLMVTCQGKAMQFQQLSNSLRNLTALIGDIVRRLCLLNPASLYPCEEGEGILLIDAVDHQLDQNMAQAILPRLHQAFPRLQIIASGNRPELLEQAGGFQCLRLENRQLLPFQAAQLQQFDEIYAQLHLEETGPPAGAEADMPALREPALDEDAAESMLLQIQQQLNGEQQRQLIRLLNGSDPDSSPNTLL